MAYVFQSAASDNQFNPHMTHQFPSIVEETKDLFPFVNWSGISEIWGYGGLMEPVPGVFAAESWANVMAHCCVVSRALHNILEFMGGAHSNSRRSDLIHSALIHDWDKKLESMLAVSSQRVEARKAIELGRSNIRLQFGDLILDLIDSTGDLGASRFHVNNISIDGLLLYYADMCVYDTDLCGRHARMLKMQPHLAKGGRYANTNQSYIKRFGIGWHDFTDTILSSIESDLLDIESSTYMSFLCKLRVGA